MNSLQVENYQAIYLGNNGNSEYVEYLNEVRLALAPNGEPRFTFSEWIDLIPPILMIEERIIIVEQKRTKK